MKWFTILLDDSHWPMDIIILLKKQQHAFESNICEIASPTGLSPTGLTWINVLNLSSLPQSYRTLLVLMLDDVQITWPRLEIKSRHSPDYLLRTLSKCRSSKSAGIGNPHT
jgi:hypothetical protein